MLLRSSKVLRILAILLFSFEVLAPALWHGESDKIIEAQKTTTYFCDQNQPIDLISHLIFEEVNNEEKEGKDYDLLSVSYVEVFNELEKFIPHQVVGPLPKDRFDIQPALYKLHSVLII